MPIRAEHRVPKKKYTFKQLRNSPDLPVMIAMSGTRVFQHRGGPLPFEASRCFDPQNWYSEGARSAPQLGSRLASSMRLLGSGWVGSRSGADLHRCSNRGNRLRCAAAVAPRLAVADLIGRVARLQLPQRLPDRGE